MNIDSLHIGMQVRHPQHGVGTVEGLSKQTADVRFLDGLKTVSPTLSDLQSAEPRAALTGIEVPLEQLIRQTVESTIAVMGVERPGGEIDDLGQRWHGGRMVLHPADGTLQTKEVPLEVFFHKIVMMRNQLRVLEQKVNGHDKLTDGEKVELQQYISRCYGSMTTFNVLFQDKAHHFSGKTE
ncbi:MAG: hypothetical protein HC814_05045 [Rhodobacteraceae bacterium]|nr:hypothetical protein [Paracoccaceae bacterium]